jgi:hypothetical protein
MARSGLNWFSVVAVFAVVATWSSGMTLAILEYMGDPAETTATNRETISSVTSLPPLSTTLGSVKWNTMEGVVAHPLQISGPNGQQALQIVSTLADGNKQISVMFTGLSPRRYRAVVWIKPGSMSRLILALRGGGAHGLAIFDLDRRATAGVEGDAQSPGLEQVENGWLRIWADAPTLNADFVASLLLSGAGPSVQREFTVGGVKLEPAG